MDVCTGLRLPLECEETLSCSYAVPANDRVEKGAGLWHRSIAEHSWPVRWQRWREPADASHAAEKTSESPLPVHRGNPDRRLDVFLLAVQGRSQDAHRDVHRRGRPHGLRRRGHPADADGQGGQRLSAKAQTPGPGQRPGPVLHVHAPELRLAGRGEAPEERRSDAPPDRARLQARHSDHSHQHGPLGHDRQLRRPDGQARHRAAAARLHGGGRLQVGHRLYREAACRRPKSAA